MRGNGRHGENVDPDRAHDFRPVEDTVVRQLIVSLTSLGNYLGAAQHIVGGLPNLDTELLSTSLEGASRQFRLASKAVRRLQHLLDLDDEEIAADDEMVSSHPTEDASVV